MSTDIRGLYAITDATSLSHPDLIARCAAALRGGARILQYRSKDPNAATRRRQAQVLRDVCADFGAIFIINDDPRLAAAVEADGVHLGRDDGSVESARALLGADAIIGVSCYADLVHAEAAVHAGADYIAFGSFYPSRTKPNAVRAPLSLLSSAKATLALPVVAIGGITPDNGAALLAAGADALAVIEGIFGQDDIVAAAARYAALFA